MAETTSEEKAPHDRLQLTVIADTLTDPIIGKARDGTSQSWNAGAEQLHGFRAEEIVVKPARWGCGHDRIS